MKKFICLIIVLFLYFNSFPSNFFEEFLFTKSTNVGFSILKISPDALISASSDGGCAGISTPSSFLINPALPSFFYKKGIIFSYRYSQGFSNIYNFAITYPSKFGTVSFSTISTISDTIQLRNEDPSSLPLGYYRFNSYSFTLGYSNSISNEVHIGLSLNNVTESSFLLQETSFTGSGGIIINLENMKNLKFAISALNTGFKRRYDQNSLDYIIPPFTLRTGLSFDFKLFENLDNTIYSDFIKINDQEFKISIGGDTKILDMLSIRYGFLINDPVKFFSFGLGVKNNRLSLNYSFTPYNYGLGFDNVVSLIYNF